MKILHPLTCHSCQWAHIATIGLHSFIGPLATLSMLTCTPLPKTHNTVSTTYCALRPPLTFNQSDFRTRTCTTPCPFVASPPHLGPLLHHVLSLTERFKFHAKKLHRMGCEKFKPNHRPMQLCNLASEMGWSVLNLCIFQTFLYSNRLFVVVIVIVFFVATINTENISPQNKCDTEIVIVN